MPGILGKYDILKTLGKGGSSKVKLGYDPDTDTKVAIKIMNEDIDDDFQDLLNTELEFMKELKHPNII